MLTSSQSFSLLRAPNPWHWAKQSPPSLLDRSHIQTTSKTTQRTPPVHAQRSLTLVTRLSSEAGLQIAWNRPIFVATTRVGLSGFLVRFSPPIFICSMEDHATDYVVRFQLSASSGVSSLRQTVLASRPRSFLGSNLNPLRLLPNKHFRLCRTLPHTRPLNLVQNCSSNLRKSTNFRHHPPRSSTTNFLVRVISPPLLF